jgi:hypothetical protein
LIKDKPEQLIIDDSHKPIVKNMQTRDVRSQSQMNLKRPNIAPSEMKLMNHGQMNFANKENEIMMKMS